MGWINIKEDTQIIKYTIIMHPSTGKNKYLQEWREEKCGFRKGRDLLRPAGSGNSRENAKILDMKGMKRLMIDS